ncbi:MAG: decaprenyl-phosphate phosphoribosyltransferase [Methanocorpusculum sp.]|nr:decaprenyl-phosphate phosphoribosyltransferase [Methanocorpusculum sp.]MDE2522859.1 decaprenyl-phosphate phosphoribosyltransferase [Methanocorpusculum sp.]MDE2523584.1 decaprenyl-phosphate phosphoribosyltransferase [Methanocorpusculum sp.]
MREGASLLRSLLKLMRPKQWVKNGFVFAPLLFSGSLFDPDLFLLCCAGALLFSLAASSVYVLNDIVDREKDRLHPKKCQRPVASGAVSVMQAVGLLAGLLVVSFAVSLYLNLWFALVLAAYFCFNLAYSFVLKHVPIVDMMCVAAMYVFRVVAGAVIIGCYTISPWIIVCTFFVSLLIAVQKRKGELAAVEEGKNEGRLVLRYYRSDILRDMAVTLGAVTITAYCLYTFQSQTSHYMLLTIPFVIFGLLRYQFLTGTTDVGETPEEIVLKDTPMVADLGLWVLVCIGILYLV